MLAVFEFEGWQPVVGSTVYVNVNDENAYAGLALRYPKGLRRIRWLALARIIK